jgi:hypothetical protein
VGRVIGGPFGMKIARRRNFLEYDEQLALLAMLLPLPEQSWAYIEKLQTANFDAFWPMLEFEMSFARSDEQLQIYKRVKIELAKVALANPNKRLWARPGGLGYLSPYLMSLRDEFVNGLAKLPAADRLKEPYDAVEIALPRLSQVWRYERPKWFASLREVDIEIEARKMTEAAFHASGISRKFFSSLERPAEPYAAIVARESAAFEFRADPKRTRGGYPVFSKPVSVGWDLCLSPEEIVWWPGERQGQAQMLLSLQAQGQHKPLRRADVSQVLLLEYGRLVENFYSAYDLFTSLDELELVLKAQFHLLSFVISDIERAVIQFLDRKSTSLAAPAK